MRMGDNLVLVNGVKLAAIIRVAVIVKVEVKAKYQLAT